MDLDLDITPRLQGRAKRPLEAVTTRELEPSDIAVLSTERGIKPTAVKRLSHRHHALARLIAEGMRHGEAGLAVGYDPSRVSILMGDPTFNELVSFYKDHKDAQYADMHERLSGLSIEAVEELRERLEESPEDFSSSQLLEIVTKAADRTGYGPASSSTNLNVNVDLAGRLQEARRRVEERRKMKTIEHQEAAE